ncbi:hypothetical protein [Methylorubrum sp. SB2]|uniref:hypothetical protein n=1 Tax=Methylorubrum subtropicum TaxID=3138812 RepID=UPI00313C2F75
MRNPFKRQPRPADKPSLRERAATLKSGLARLLTRPAGQGEANQQRRALVAGSVAAAIPLPVLARAATPAAFTAEAPPLALPALIADPHPDRALLDLGAALDRAIEASTKAREAREAAWAIVEAALLRRPIELAPSLRDWGLTHPTVYGREPPEVREWHCGTKMRSTDFEARALPEDHQRWQHAWTGAGLRYAIANAVRYLGRGGQTPHDVRRWRALLPIADAFDAEVAKAYAASDYNRLKDEAASAAAKVRGLRIDIRDLTATTPEGLAVHVRLALADEPQKTADDHSALMCSAAAVAGVPLPVSDFDAAAWVAAWEKAGGRIKWIPSPCSHDELGFVWPNTKVAGLDAQPELQALARVQQQHSRTIDRWLRANR